ncbi:MAG TPA: 4-amino-4-deoxychorismate lyase [Desulfovibrio sp.]|nr:4-amino-4-deoxychorismate lyase [Desulfovibrio sp.]
MATPRISSQEWIQKVQNTPRKAENFVTAFYEHSIGAICTDARLLRIPLDDHLVHRGDGCFESLTIAENRVLELDAHIARLEHSAAKLGIQAPLSYDEIRQIVLDTAKAGGAAHGSVKLLMGRGEGGLGISPKECPVASFYCVAAKGNPPAPSYWEKGITACRSAIPAKQPFLAQIKSTNYLPNVFMAQEAEAKGVDVSISFDEDGYLAEAAIANVGIIDKNNIFVLPHFKRALAGTTALMAKSIAETYMRTETRNIREEEIFDAKEFLLFGTGSQCVAITHYEGKKIADGVPMENAKKLQKLIYQKLIETGTPF